MYWVHFLHFNRALILKSTEIGTPNPHHCYPAIIYIMLFEALFLDSSVLTDDKVFQWNSSIYIWVCLCLSHVYFYHNRSGFPPSQDIRDDLQRRRGSQILHTGLVPALGWMNCYPLPQSTSTHTNSIKHTPILFPILSQSYTFSCND